tara:strand:- start:1430 stop:2269 length:840 start_codon:yes stop_codon:yes gene_type:complete
MGLLSVSAFSCDVNGDTGFLPENDLKISTSAKFRSDMTEERFNEIIDHADKFYAPIVKEKGGKLKWSRGWNNDTVNASAQRTFWGTWKVNMYGGLARHPLVTDDGFALVVCHELGHHLAGTPTNSFPNSWASVEGQSDYFATLKCFRRLYESEDNQAIVAAMTDVPATVVTKCEKNFTLPNDRALCVRASMGGLSLAKLLGSLRGNTDIDFDTPDTNVVSSTNSRHPEAQCRLDTYFQGALCDVAIAEEVGQDPLAGTCNRVDNYIDGVRPLCWYKPAE